MGLDKNADGEWEVVRNRVPPGLVNAMRAMRVKSERRSQSTTFAISRRASEVRVKTEPTGDEGDIYRADSSDVEMEDAPIDPNQVVDLTDCAAEWEEIRIYLDVKERWKVGTSWLTAPEPKSRLSCDLLR